MGTREIWKKDKVALDNVLKAHKSSIEGRHLRHFKTADLFRMDLGSSCDAFDKLIATANAASPDVPDRVKRGLKAVGLKFFAAAKVYDATLKTMQKEARDAELPAKIVDAIDELSKALSVICMKVSSGLTQHRV